MLAAIPLYVFHPALDALEAYSKRKLAAEGVTNAGQTFARHFGTPPDTMEDPFTGSATGGMAAYLWHFETGQPAGQTFDSPLLGVHEGTAYYLLYNGILGDRRPDGGNVLTGAVFAWLREQFPHDGPKVIYGETTRLGETRQKAENQTFKQIPYDIRAR